MPSLEYVVRPYQSPGPHGTIIIPSTPKGTRERATLTWGAKTELPVPDTGVNVTCCSEGLKEKDRTSKKIRVFQNDDNTSANWVDVERPQTMNLSKTDKNDCISDWDQVSQLAADIRAELDADAADFGSPTVPEGNCGVTWTFKN
jgi:hypothetical protein